MSNKLPWNERVTMLSVNPEAATIGDIARLAAEWCEMFDLLQRIPNVTDPDSEIARERAEFLRGVSDE